MSLRYRLFLWIGALFFIAFFLSLFWENIVTKQNLVTAEISLRQEIVGLDEQKRENVKRFLAQTLTAVQAQIDSSLQYLSEYGQLSAQFAPIAENAQGTWFNACAFLLTNKWVDFVQNTTDGQLLSLLIVDENFFKPTQKLPIDEDLSWVLMEGQPPLLGVRCTFDIAKGSRELSTFDPNLYLLFDPNQEIKYALPSELTPPLLPSFSLTSLPLLLAKANQYLQKAPSHPSERNAWIKQQISERFKEKTTVSHCLPAQNPLLSQELKSLLHHSDQTTMIWRLGVLLSSNLFGPSPFAPHFPPAIARFPSEQNGGAGVLVSQMLRPHPLFDAAKYAEEHSSSLPCWKPANALAIITPSFSKEVLLSNVLKITRDNKSSYLTLGVDVRKVLKELVLALHEDAFLVHDKKIINAMTAEGNEILIPQIEPELMQQLLTATSGTVLWKGQNYFFLHMIPIPDLDLHFFLLNLEEKEFALIKDLNQGVKEVLRKISVDMRIGAVIGLALVLFILYRISLGITKPITRLASATKSIGKGRLEEIDLPVMPERTGDEIATLCNSFARMVQGLKEKEKVKGVLNKVVSAEIAQEILKGTIQLGGEEKEVTVLFADIRNFTHLTQNMPSQEVIALLNSCMTTISHVIDEHKGVIDKYVGDEVMALFGAPLSREDSALNAILGAIEMQSALSLWNEERSKQNLPSITMGIGIHTGKVVAGNMGAENRLNYTVLGSNVNLASRLCSVALGQEVLISESTLNAPHVRDRIEVEALPPMQFKGFDLPVAVYRVKGVKSV